MENEIKMEERKEQITEEETKRNNRNLKNLNSNLIIEENTIYEIDQECMSCLEKGKTSK